MDKIFIRNISIWCGLSALQLEFEWQRDPAGYRLVEAPWPYARRSRQPSADTAGTKISATLGIRPSVGRQYCIIPRSGVLKRYSPLLEFSNLFELFARDVVSPESLLAFVEKFGPLTQFGLDQHSGENVGLGIADAIAMKIVMAGHFRGTEGLLAVTGDSGLPLGEMGVTLFVDPSNAASGLNIKLKIRDLRTAMWMQLGQSLSQGSKLRQCAFCQSLFVAGPKTGRRADAQFCSDQHRIDFHSKRRTSKEG
jgi:hypothetical protein